MSAYAHISLHYKFAISNVFERFHSEGLIILEDDMLVSPDFFGYFEKLIPIVIKDDTLIAASAWNDNGKKTFAKDPNAVIRTSFFPGLGWFLPAKTWKSLGSKWPVAYWDDWLRDQMADLKKDCVYPEVSRTYTFGEKGSSGGQFFYEFLANIQLNNKSVDWEQIDLSYISRVSLPLPPTRSYPFWFSHLFLLLKNKV